MSAKLDLDKIAEQLGAERRGTIKASGGYFGALELAADVQARFMVPRGGGRPTDPRWTERRLIALSAETLNRLERLAGRLRIAPLQVAAVILEKTIENIKEEDLVSDIGSAEKLRLRGA